MVYEYQCSTCGQCFDIEHPMSETQNPSPETIKKISCPDFGECPNDLKIEDVESIKFNRVFTSTILKFESLSPSQKKEVFAKRSKVDFVKNIEERKRDMQGSAVNQLKNLGKK